MIKFRMKEGIVIELLSKMGDRDKYFNLVSGFDFCLRIISRLTIIATFGRNLDKEKNKNFARMIFGG